MLDRPGWSRAKLVSGDGAVMLLSSGRRPYGETKWVQETLWIRGGRQWLNSFQKARGLNLDIDGWLRGIGLAQHAEIQSVRLRCQPKD